MGKPKKNRKFTIIDLILILLAVISIWVLLEIIGGHSYHFIPSGNGPSLLEGITRGLSSLGEGIKNAFSGLLR